MNFDRKKLWGVFAFRALKAIHNRLQDATVEQSEAFGRRFGDLFYALDARRRRTALSNLELAYPKWSAEKRQKVARECFRHFGIVAADFLASLNRSREELEETMTIDGIENLDEALAKGKGVLLIGGHFGNFERFSAWLSLAGYKLTVIIRDADDDGVNGIVNRLRTGPGTNVVPRGDSIRPILERLKKGEIVGILADQNTDDIFLPFFGKTAGCNLGPGILQNRTGAAVVPFYSFRSSPGQYKVVVSPEIYPLEGYEAKGEGMMRAINAYQEGAIRLHPEQWLWLHDRWRAARQRGLL